MASKQVTNNDLYAEINNLRRELVQRDEMLEDKVDKTYLRIQVFEAKVKPLEKFVYGLISVAGAALVTAIIGFLIASK